MLTNDTRAKQNNARKNITNRAATAIASAQELAVQVSKPRVTANIIVAITNRIEIVNG